MAQPFTETVDKTLSPPQQLFVVVRLQLSEQLRSVFEVFEQSMLASGDRMPLICELRRHRRLFIENYVRQLSVRVDQPDAEWIVGTASGISHARTLLYLSDADTAVRNIYHSQGESSGRLAAAWIHWTTLPCTALSCPLGPHVLARLFFLLLSDLPVPLRIRCGLAACFIETLPNLFRNVQQVAVNFMQRKGVLVASLIPVALPEWWEPLQAYPAASIEAQKLVVPAALQHRMQQLAVEMAQLALAGDYESLELLAVSNRQTALLPWLSETLAGGCFSTTARDVLALLAGPLLFATQHESFADGAHPARRVLDEWTNWAPGWLDTPFLDSTIVEQQRELAANVASVLLTQPEQVLSAWSELLDYLLALRKRVQSDISACVASTRLSLQVMAVRTEVDALLREHIGIEYWPQVVVDILHGAWSSLLMEIHWREGTASDAWLNAVAVANALIVSVQPGLDRVERQRVMSTISQLLQKLKTGFVQIGCDRKTYSALLSRLEKVHLALLQGVAEAQIPEPLVRWPEAAALPKEEEPFEVGRWLQREDGSRWQVVFSDPLCTVLLDTQTAGLMSCSTADLQEAFYAGDLAVMPMPAFLLSPHDV